MRFPLFLGLVLFSGASAAESSSPRTPLLNAPDLAGWKYVSPGPEQLAQICHPLPGGVVAVAGKPNGFIATTKIYENYTLHAEWRWSDKPGNGGILLHIVDGPMDRIWPISFQVQTKNTRVGDVLPMSTAKFAEAPTPDVKPPQLARHAPDSEKPVGEWNSCDVVCRGDTIEVSINGVAQNRVTKCVPAAGAVGFQLEGVPFELRNVWIEPLTAAVKN